MLGHGDTSLRTMPMRVKMLQKKAVQEMMCGGRHSGALLCSGEVYMWVGTAA